MRALKAFQARTPGTLTKLPKGKDDEDFKKKPELALELIDKCDHRGHRPGIVLLDGGYGNNSSLLKKLEERKLEYCVAIAKNRNVIWSPDENKLLRKNRLDEVAELIKPEAFQEITLPREKTKTVWVALVQVEISRLQGKKTVAIVMNDTSVAEATEIDYLLTNVNGLKITAKWLISTYTQRNWIEVFYREAKGWLGLKEYQVRGEISLYRHWILVFCAYTFIHWHWLTGGLRRQWANKQITTFVEALEAFRTAVSYRFFHWLQDNIDLFASHRASLGYVWR